MMGTEIFKIDAPWAEKLTKTRVSFLMNPSVFHIQHCVFSANTQNSTTSIKIIIRSEERGDGISMIIWLTASSQLLGTVQVFRCLPREGRNHKCVTVEDVRSTFFSGKRII